MTKRHPPHGFGNGISKHALKKIPSSGAGNLAFGESRHIEQANILRNILHLIAHMLVVVGTTERPDFLHFTSIIRNRMVVVRQNIWFVQLINFQTVAFRSKPVGTFPAINRTKHSTQRLLTLIGWRTLQRACRNAFFIGIMHRENIGIGFFVLFLQIILGHVRAKTARINPHHINGRFAVDNPLRQLPASTTSCSDTEGMPLIEPEILLVPSRTDNRATIRRIGNRTIIGFLDARLTEIRNPLNRGFDIGHQPINIFLKQLVFTLVARPVHIAAWSTFFIRPKQQTASFFTHIPS